MLSDLIQGTVGICAVGWSVDESVEQGCRPAGEALEEK